MFTVKQIENLKPKEKRYQVREGNGFGVQVFPNGTKIWFYSYKIHGRSRSMSLGSVTNFSLEEGRSKAKEARDLVMKGVDPLETRVEEDLKPTMERAIELYLLRAEKRMRPRSYYEEQRMFNKYVPVAWQYRKVKDIRRGEILHLLETIVLDAPQMANQFQKALHRFFVYCVNREYADHNPCSNMEKPSESNKRERWLTEQEIKVLWDGLQDAKMIDQTRRALQIALVTAQRAGEIVRMRYEDIDGHWWTIPQKDSKNKLSHRVYLTDMALGIIGQGKGYVFPSPRSEKSHIHRGTLSRALFINDHFSLFHCTTHDLRRTAASHMTSNGVSRFIVSRILNHSDSSVTAVYDRNSYDKEKQEAMEVWSQRLQTLLSQP